MEAERGKLRAGLEPRRLAPPPAARRRRRCRASAVAARPQAEADAGAELKVVARARGGLDDGVSGREVFGQLFVPAVADQRVARVEAREDAARGVDLDGTAEVEREVRLPLRDKVDGEEPAAVEPDEALAEHRGGRLAERDQPGSRLGEEAEAPEAPAGFDAELHLEETPASDVGVLVYLEGEDVRLGFEGEGLREVVSHAGAGGGFPGCAGDKRVWDV